MSELGGNIVASLEVPPEETGSYGMVVPGQGRWRAAEVKGLVEKPPQARRLQT